MFVLFIAFTLICRFVDYDGTVGFMGLIFGPILISLTLLLIQIYNDEFTDEEKPQLIDSHESENKEDENSNDNKTNEINFVSKCEI